MTKDSILGKIKKLPTTPGVYIFKSVQKKILYVGKAASLKSRVRSYFGLALAYERPIEFVIDQIADVQIKKTETVIEAYFLEQELIKKHQPKYNVIGKDDRSFVYVCVTKENFPRFIIERKTDLEDQKLKVKSMPRRMTWGQKYNSKLETKKRPYTKIYGPFSSKVLTERALRILRKIFPYHDKKQKTEKGCLDFQIGLCPGPYVGEISKKDYAKNIHGIEMMLKGRKKILIRNIEKEMKKLAKEQKFEEARVKRDQIFSLKHIQDIALISERDENSKFKSQNSKNFRIEGYDISNISGKFCVGSMIVFDNKNGIFEPSKRQYRKFRIKTVEGANDIGSMREILERRFKNDWRLPSLILLDGGRGHLNMARRVIKENNLSIPIVAVAKGSTRKNCELRITNCELDRKAKEILKNKKLIKQIMDEAHRFAINYHRNLRKKGMVKSAKCV